MNARLHGLPLKSLRQMRGEHNQRDCPHNAFEFSSCVEAVHLGHGKVENDEIRVEMLSLKNSLSSVPRLTANHPARF